MAHARCKLETYGYKHTLGIRNTYCFSLQQWLHKHTSVLRYTYIAYLVNQFVHSFIHSFVRSFVRSFVLSFVHSFIHSLIHSFIPLACAECDDSLPFSRFSSIPLCYIPFPSTLFHQLVFHPPSLYIAVYFLV
jgi:hypothetical protein